MMRNDSPDPDMERRLRDHFADEAEDLRAPDDLWDRLESRLGEQDPPRFALLRGGMAWLQGWTVERPGMATAAAAVLVLAIGITTWSLMGGDGVGDEEADYDVAATSATTTTTTTTATTATTTTTSAATTGASTSDVASDADDASSAPARTPRATATPGSVAPATVVAGQASEQADEATPAATTTPPAPTATSTPPATSVKQLPPPTLTTRPPRADATPTPAAVVATPPRATEPDSSTPDAAHQAEADTEDGMDADDGMDDAMGDAMDDGMADMDDGMDDGMDSDRMAEPDDGDASDEAPSAQQPPPATTFEDYERMPFIETSVDAVSTFSLDTDRASYFLALNWARNGYTVEPRSVRAEEWVNAFDYGYAPPEVDYTFALTTDVVRHPLDDGLHLARIALQAPEFRDDTPLNVTLVLDASGSMDQGNRVAIARAAAEAIRESLGADDRIAVVHFSTGVLDRFTVEHSAPDDEDVARSISSLAAHDRTNVQAGLNLGVQLADAARRERPEAFNYIFLMSDGVANVDATDPFAILESAADTNSRNPLRLITIGVGIENYNDVLLEQLAQYGNGWYRYLDDTAQAEATFSRENWLVLSTPFADQARAQVTWDPAVVKSWRIIGYENRVTPDHAFTQDRKEFAEIPAGTAVTVFYELELWSETSFPRALGDVALRWVQAASGASAMLAGAAYERADRPFGSADEGLRFGAVVGLAADRYSSLSAQVDGQPVDAAGVRADLHALQHELDALAAHLGSTEAFRDFDLLLDALADAAEALAPSSGYSR